MYLAKLVKKNDDTLLDFKEDIQSVRYAENVILDALVADIKAIEEELEKIHKTAAEEAARLEAADELKPFSLTDLKELKTAVHIIDKVQHFNKVDHLSGRTPMERFALNTQEALKQTNKKIEDLKKKYANLLEYFGEDEKMPSNEFFGVMRRFIEEFGKACDEVDKLEKERVSTTKMISCVPFRRSPFASARANASFLRCLSVGQAREARSQTARGRKAKGRKARFKESSATCFQASFGYAGIEESICERRIGRTSQGRQT